MSEEVFYWSPRLLEVLLRLYDCTHKRAGTGAKRISQAIGPDNIMNPDKILEV